MKIEKKIHNNFIVFEIDGVIEHETIAYFKNSIDQVVNDKFDYIGINFKKLKYINSLGIGYLVYLKKKIESLNKKLVLIELNEYNKKIFEILNIESIFNFCDNNKDFLNKKF